MHTEDFRRDDKLNNWSFILVLSVKLPAGDIQYTVWMEKFGLRKGVENTAMFGDDYGVCTLHNLGMCCRILNSE